MEQEIVLASFALSPAGMMVTLLLACVGASTPSPSPSLAGKGSEGWLRLFRLSGRRPSTGGAPFEADKGKGHLSTAEEVAPRVWSCRWVLMGEGEEVGCDGFFSLAAGVAAQDDDIVEGELADEDTGLSLLVLRVLLPLVLLRVSSPLPS